MQPPLARHPNVILTRYPGPASHATHDAVRRRLKGFGTIISFDARGDAPTPDAVCSALQLIQHATSLGAVESTIERRASVAAASDAATAARGIKRPRGACTQPITVKFAIHFRVSLISRRLRGSRGVEYSSDKVRG